MSEKGKTIRFIDSDYKELFQIPDGGSIKITYPPDDGREPAIRVCKYLDEMHFQTLGRGGDIYHSCQFAEMMERIGAKYEPEIQLRNTELVPFTLGEEKFYTYNREEGNTCVGHIAGDFSHSGDRFHSGWNNHKTREEQDWNGSSPEFQTELHSAVYALRQSLLKDYDSMATYCQAHPEAMLDSGETYKRYGFKLETDTRQYYTQCFVDESIRDSRFIIYAYENPDPAIEKAQPAFGTVVPGTADDSKMFYRNSESVNPCIGHLRGDFGKNGGEFHHNWFESNSGRKMPEFQAEFQIVMDMLRQDVLKDLKSTQDYCYSHPEAQLPGDIHRYGFKLETETRQFFVRCTVIPNDYFYVFAYDKNSVREQERSTVPADDKLSTKEGTQKDIIQATTQIYKYSADYALKNGEIELFHESAKVNMECAKAIDTAIQACNFERYRYKMSDAVKSVVDDFGFERVNWILAVTIHQHSFDGRFSSSNQKWARDFGIPNERHRGFSVQTHLAVLDGFISSVRKAHVEMLAESVGSYEKSHNMADRNRLTWFHNDFGTFVPKEGITEQRLLERHNEITEKKSVLAQIRAERKAQKQSSVPKTERNKKKQEPEL